ncbi:unnamed protein product [Aphanomyces euteiches]
MLSRDVQVFFPKVAPSVDMPAITTYTFSQGIFGTVTVVHRQSGGAKIVADLDVSQVDKSALDTVDANCASAVVSAYKWHIHTKWTHGDALTSGVFGQCSLAAAGNHYDPDFACGPNSEYVTHDKCKPITPLYNCTPASYATNQLACERGDLSGKVGDMKVIDGKIYHSWFDEHYPAVKATPEWNMLLHAICNKATPRVACATGVTTTAPFFATSVGIIAAALFVALIACFGLRNHPWVGRFYPTNLVVVAGLGLLALVVYDDVVVDLSI